jgi:hypothetical protein
MQPCNRIYYSKNLLKAQHVSSGIPLIIRSSKLYLQRPVTTWVYKPEAANTVWSSWWWAVCRSKHVEPSINCWNNKFYYMVACCWLFLLIPFSKFNVIPTRLHACLKIEMFTVFPTDRSFCHVAYDFLKNSNTTVIMIGKKALSGASWLIISVFCQASQG